MALVNVTNVIVPELLAEAVRRKLAAKTALLGTGAAIVNTSLENGRSKVGTSVKIPRFGILPEAEDIATDGDALTPAAYAMDSNTATVLHSGLSFEMTYLAQNSASDDIYEDAANQIVERVGRRIDKELISKGEDETGWASYIHDITGTGTLNYSAIVAAMTLLGDEGFTLQDYAALVVHSKVFGDMLNEKDGDSRPLLMPNAYDGTLPRYLGVPVIVSDRLTVTSGSPDTYKSMLCKKNALAAWIDGAGVEIMTDKDILKHTDVAAVHFYYAAHRYAIADGTSKPGVVIIKSQ